MALIAVIGGSSLEQMPDLQIEERVSQASRYGKPSSQIVRGKIDGSELLFLSRHGDGHEIAPHRVNYRANIDALQSLGATEIVAVNTVGAIREDMACGDIVIPDQLIDYTWGREGSFFDGKSNPLKHIDFTHPFSESLRQKILAKSEDLDTQCHPSATYACTQGPRLETAAEIDRFKREGSDIVGMTLCPEAALAAELGITYASICLVVNPAAGLTDKPLSEAEITSTARRGIGAVVQLLRALIAVM